MTHKCPSGLTRAGMDKGHVPEMPPARALSLTGPKLSPKLYRHVVDTVVHVYVDFVWLAIAILTKCARMHTCIVSTCN